MTIRATRASKRQPFGERSVTSVTVASKTNKNKKRVQRRKSRQIGDDVAIYIQEKKSKAGKLHRAKVDNKTGGISFTPGNRKTPISYDRHRHTLIEKTPDGEEVEVELDTESEKENLKHCDSSDSEMEAITSKKTNKIVRPAAHDDDTKKEKHTRRKAIKSYEESASEEEESDDESDFEEPAPTKKVPKKQSKRRAAAKQDTATRNNTKRRDTIETAELDESDDCEDEVTDKPVPAREGTATFSSPIVKSDWEDHQPDWRCMSAVDY
eukprot:CAMPEP_0119003950 /NCGR_PEP_ID=MMETSP1176-20130426/858_1 /TAXON_ID=265551 /ORGANISM="Synedropsis recta cf, Strain CCMP1620" /LENGTH=266 /DNA_ID=CAMNT_0006955601 /DNA_START=162 /DNA_END=962 /DNA_ORIENTATION=-